MKLALIGTSRLHRPFAKLHEGRLFTNCIEGVSILFLRLGYMHTAAEALQAMRYISGQPISPEVWRYVFRMEARHSTPLNEFDPTVEASMRANTPAMYPLDIYREADCFLVEVSSLSQNIHAATNTVVHTNPNLEVDIPYKEIYPEGFYAKFKPELGVLRKEVDLDELIEQLTDLRHQANGRPIIVMGHLTDGSPQLSGRTRANETLKAAAKVAALSYFDTLPLVRRYGFNVVDGMTDIHHLPQEGEVDIGRQLQYAAQDACGLAGWRHA